MSSGSVIEALCAAVVAPASPLPPVGATDAVEAFGRLVAAGPALNRFVVRGTLILLDLAPFAVGQRRRLRSLPPERRDAVVRRLEHGPLAPALRPMRSLLHLAYYGDLGVMRLLGYDPVAVVAGTAAP